MTDSLDPHTGVADYSQHRLEALVDSSYLLIFYSLLQCLHKNTNYVGGGGCVLWTPRFNHTLICIYVGQLTKKLSWFFCFMEE